MCETPPSNRLKAFWVLLCFTVLALMGRAEAQSITLAWDKSPSPNASGYIVAYGVNTNELAAQRMWETRTWR